MAFRHNKADERADTRNRPGKITPSATARLRRGNSLEHQRFLCEGAVPGWLAGTDVGFLASCIRLCGPLAPRPPAAVVMEIAAGDGYVRRDELHLPHVDGQGLRRQRHLAPVHRAR